MSFFSERPRSGRDLQPRSNDDESTLDSILNTAELRTELALLVALCSDIMRRNLAATFDIQGTNSPMSAPGRTPLAEDNTGATPSSNECAASPNREDRRDDSLGLDSTEMQGLKRGAITFFDKWQISVLRRLGEVLNVRSDAIRKARAIAREKADQKAKAARNEANFTSAEGRDDNKGNEPQKSAGEPKIWATFEVSDTKLLQIDEEKRVAVLNALLLMLLSLERYTAHSRILLQHVASSLNLASTTLGTLESKVAESLLATAASSMSADASTKRAAASNAANKRWKVGLATVAGAAVIGLTGGLAAPLLAAGAGAIMGGLGLGAIASLLGPLATNMVLVGSLFGAYGGRMTGNLMGKYEKEVDDFRFIPIKNPRHDSTHDDIIEGSDDAKLNDEEQREQHKLRVAIGISGWLTSPSDVTRPWRVLSSLSLEPFALRYELEALLRLGESLLSALRSYTWDFAKFRLLTLVFAGLWPLGLLRIASLIDSPFIIAKARTDKAGKVLADALIHKVQGERPVTLIGYSLGARVIHSCLLELAAQNAFGLVEGVVLMGSPIPSDHIVWRKMSSVVAGKIVNVYSEADFLLGFMYRAASVQHGVAGLQPIQNVARVSNVNVTDMVKEHTSYSYSIGVILRQIGFSDLDEGLVDKQSALLKRMEQEEEGQQQKQHEGSASKDNEMEDGTDPDRLEQIVMVDNEQEEKKRLDAAEEDIKERKQHMWENKENLKDQDSSGGPNVQDAIHRVESTEDIADLVDADTLEDSASEGRREMLTVLLPEAEPDIGPDFESLHFDSRERDVNVT